MQTGASVIIPTCNRTSELRDCLSLLLPQLPSDGTVTVFVCDDGTDGKTRVMVNEEFPALRWNEGPRRGPRQIAILELAWRMESG